MLEKAIKIAKGDDVEKVGMSVKMPVTLKEELVGLAERNDVSTNSLICSILQLSLEEGIKSGSIHGQPLVTELQRLEERKEKILRFIDENGGLDANEEKQGKIIDEFNSINTTIDTLKWILK